MPCALAQCPRNAYNALVKRHLAAPKNKAQSRVYNVFLRELKEPLISEYLAALEGNLREEWTVGKKLTKLAAIARSHAIETPRRNEADSFVKFEAPPKVPTKARLIQGNANELTAYEFPEEYRAMSIALKNIKEHTVTISGIAFTLVYAGGMNHNELSDLVTKWISLPGTIYYDERDGKNWDSTMQNPTLTAEYYIYDMLKMQAAKAFKQRCRFVKGRIRCRMLDGIFKLVYTTVMKRLSGDWNTSVGNTIISIIICVASIIFLPNHLKPKAVKALFMGDDYLGLYYYGSNPPAATELALAMDHNERLHGIEPVRAIFTNPLLVSFISLGLWPRHGYGYQFVPYPARQMTKLMWSVKRLHPNSVEHYRSALCIAFWPVYHGFPLMMKFLKLQYTIRHPKFKFENNDIKWWLEPHTTVARDVDWRTGFMEKYRLPYTCLDLDWPNGLEGQCAVLRCPIIQYMLAIESQDPPERCGNVSHPDQIRELFVAF